LPALRPPATSSAHVAFQIGADVGLRSWSANQIAVPGVGLSAVVERAGATWRLGGWLRGELRRSFDAGTRDADVRIGGGAVHLMVVLGRRVGRLGIVRLALGPGVVVTSASPAPRPGGTATVDGQERTDIDEELRAALRWDLPIAGPLVLVTAVAVDITPVSGAYTAVVDGKSQVVFAAWPVRPALFVGLAFGSHAR
jgi:hypothetical protein